MSAYIFGIKHVEISKWNTNVMTAFGVRKLTYLSMC